MQTELPFFILCVLIHSSIYLSSDKSDRLVRLLLGMTILFVTVPAWYVRAMMESAGEPLDNWLGFALRLAPFYVNLLSFLVYIRRQSFS